MASSLSTITNRKILIFLGCAVLLSYASPTILGLKPVRLTPRDALTPLEIKEQEAQALRSEISKLEDRLVVLTARNKLAEQAQELAQAKSKEAADAFAKAEEEALVANDAFDAADLKEKEAEQALRYARMTETQAREALREASEKEKTAQLALSTAQKLQAEANKALSNAQTQSRLATRTLAEIEALELQIAELNSGLVKVPEDTEKAEDIAAPGDDELTPSYRDRPLPNPGKAVLVYEDGLVPAHKKLRIPAGLETLDVKRRKQEFIALLLPLIIQSNDMIQSRRESLIEAKSKGDWAKIEKFAQLYGLRDFDGTQDELYEALLNRIAPIPASLALAQAAVESGWGQSRFAKEGNALFGQWAWRADQGIKPLNASNDRAVIRSFATIYDSVFAYMHNLNTHRAYQDLRDVRAQALQATGRASGLSLARYLTSYAELGDKYVFTLQSMILQNRFDVYETYQLDG